ncbi:transposase [Methylocapsa acidiphila]|uniref:transposase n=1 Tax=Methylocapsa acidiphila TaxID=133552 RepID=UPI000424694F|nr:transposase [Methylocapsa acidiphila]
MAKVIAATASRRLEIVKRSDLHRFVALSKGWIGERTFASISRNRRLARDYERYDTTFAAFVHLAMIRLMLDARSSQGFAHESLLLGSASSTPKFETV